MAYVLSYFGNRYISNVYLAPMRDKRGKTVFSDVILCNLYVNTLTSSYGLQNSQNEV